VCVCVCVLFLIPTLPHGDGGGGEGGLRLWPYHWLCVRTSFSYSGAPHGAAGSAPCHWVQDHRLPVLGRTPRLCCSRWEARGQKIKMHLKKTSYVISKSIRESTGTTSIYNYILMTANYSQCSRPVSVVEFLSSSLTQWFAGRIFTTCQKRYFFCISFFQGQDVLRWLSNTLKQGSGTFLTGEP